MAMNGLGAMVNNQNGIGIGTVAANDLGMIINNQNRISIGAIASNGLGTKKQWLKEYDRRLGLGKRNSQNGIGISAMALKNAPVDERIGVRMLLKSNIKKLSVSL